VPYDSGLAIVAHPAPHRAAMGLQASYLIRGTEEERIGMDWAPESSRRARVIPLYVLFRTLGRSGIQAMIRRTVTLARRMAARLTREDGVSVLNDVVLNQVLVRFDGRGAVTADDMTKQVIARVQADGTCWAGGARWFDQEVMRISVSNGDLDGDIDRSADAIVASYAASGGARAFQGRRPTSDLPSAVASRREGFTIRIGSVGARRSLPLPSVVFAQATIAGVVRDASAAVLPGVSVETSSLRS
jgi:glutamate/tyrosine decarboxylase-like PLP-dependent enzyme